MLQLKNAENGSDKVKTRKKKILMYQKKYMNFLLFAILILDEPLCCSLKTRRMVQIKLKQEKRKF